MSDFASYLREKRHAAGLNQSELAERVGLTGSYISVLESRKKPPPSDTVLKRLADALGVEEEEILEVAHLDRSPDDIRQKIRALDRRLKIERKLTKSLLTDLLPSSLWHFGRVQGFHESAIEKLRLDARRKRILRSVLARLGPLTSRDDFEERSRAVVEAMSDEDRGVLFEVIPELFRDPAPPRRSAEPEPPRLVPVLDRPSERGGEVVGAQPLAVADHRPECWFLVAPDAEMAPRVQPGDHLLVAPRQAPEAGDLVVVEIDGRITVRQAAPTRSALLLVAAGGSAPVEIDPEGVLGVVVELRRRRV